MRLYWGKYRLRHFESDLPPRGGGGGGGSRDCLLILLTPSFTSSSTFIFRHPPAAQSTNKTKRRRGLRGRAPPCFIYTTRLNSRRNSYLVSEGGLSWTRAICGLGNISTTIFGSSIFPVETLIMSALVFGCPSPRSSSTLGAVPMKSGRQWTGWCVNRLGHQGP